MTHSTPALVFMGVAGCGKSTVATAVASALGRDWIEGDHFHSDASRQKMAQGQPLTDADRAGWLAALADKLASEPGVMLTCSALKRSYRDQLRQAAPDLRFVFLDLDKSEARRRIELRGGHFFPAHLIDSQFNTLESPVGEAGVLRVDATRPLPELQAQICHWLLQPLTP
ncbi:gluconokinase [Roseateles sp.]|uniref:gluconokinase n=1 Tax=Roseateles sp. TaxID=1971397 RepID=UPI0039647FFA